MQPSAPWDNDPNVTDAPQEAQQASVEEIAPTQEGAYDFAYENYLRTRSPSDPTAFSPFTADVFAVDYPPPTMATQSAMYPPRVPIDMHPGAWMATFPPPPPPRPISQPITFGPPRNRTSQSMRHGPTLRVSTSGSSSSRGSTSSPNPMTVKGKDRSQPTWSAEWLHEASSTPWYPLDKETTADGHVPLAQYLSTFVSPPREPLSVRVDPYFGSTARSEDQVQTAWQESYPTLSPNLVPAFGRATYNRVRVQLGATSVHPETRLLVRLYILRVRKPSIGVADDFYWEALHECQCLAGWSTIPTELSIVKPKKLRGEPTLSSAIFALRVSFSPSTSNPDAVQWSSMFSLVRRSYETLRRRNAQQAASGKRSPSLPISEAPHDRPISFEPPISAPPFSRSWSTPDYRLSPLHHSGSMSLPSFTPGLTHQQLSPQALSPWQVFSPDYAMSGLPPTAEQQLAPPPQPTMNPYPYLLASSAGAAPPGASPVLSSEVLPQPDGASYQQPPPHGCGSW